MPASPTLSRRLALGCLRRLGWQVLIPDTLPDKAVIVAYPHTSNWDFPLGMLWKIASGRRCRWIAKDSLFRWPLGAFMRGLGGIPVNRRQPAGFVDAVAAEFAASADCVVAIAPEGTRSLTPGWKSGFHRIARAAGVPILLGTIDYGRRRIGIIGSLTASDDVEADMAKIAAVYADCRGCRPQLAAPIRLVPRADDRTNGANS